MKSTILTIDNIMFWVFYYYNETNECIELDNISLFNDMANQDIGGLLSVEALDTMLNMIGIKKGDI